MASNKEEDMSRVSRPEAADSSRNTSITRNLSPALRRDASSTSAVPTLRKQSSVGLGNPASASAGTSPQTSRNTSPIRPSLRQETPQTGPRAGGLRSRKNSHDASPSRVSTTTTSPAHSVPSAAAIQRALSATTVPQLHPGPVTEAVSRLPRTSRTAPATEASTPVNGSFSPRAKSPPPSAPISRRNSLQRSQGAAPPINVQTSTPPGSADGPKTDGTSDKEQQLRAPVKAASRGPSGPKSNLETVLESTPPNNSVLVNAMEQSFSSGTGQNKSSDEDRRSATLRGKPADIKDKQSRAAESESEGNKSDGRGRTQDPPSMAQLKPKAVPDKRAAPLSARSRQGDGTRNMTVETETVSSIPQSQLSADRSGMGRGEGSGSVRLKASNETIRPRKERKRPARKAPSVHSGTASSKADIFEARVASAVDEANSSDSDETFVYESNPPEPQHRAHRNHSRTPSATSVQSQSERRGLRGYMDSHRVAGKRSMKFSNNPYSVLDSPTDGESGTIRAHHPRHISRFGRNVGSNSSLYDQESPFTQASKLRTNLANYSRNGSRPGTPQTPKPTTPTGQHRSVRQYNKKDDLSQYDFEGDDERTPLIGTVRTPRNRHTRRSTSGQYEHIYNLRQPSWINRFGGCILLCIVIVLIIIGASSFLVMSNKTLYDVQVRKITNVLASEQEIMLDLLVGAVNPNVLGVTVTEMDVNVFAKSSHLSAPKVSSDLMLSTTAPKRGSKGSQRRASASRYAIAGTPWQDPHGHWGGEEDGELEGDSQTMLLGRIFRFDQSLYFEGSPLQRHTHFSQGEMRLAKPGNKTEAGGSARWERVIQYPFELILRGVIKYQLPISNRAQSSAISGSVIVHPEEGVDSFGNMRIEEVDRSEQWEWIEPDDAT